jgi:hypothetical protein
MSPILRAFIHQRTKVVQIFELFRQLKNLVSKPWAKYLGLAYLYQICMTQSTQCASKPEKSRRFDCHRPEETLESTAKTRPHFLIQRAHLSNHLRKNSDNTNH